MGVESIDCPGSRMVDQDTALRFLDDVSRQSLSIPDYLRRLKYEFVTISKTELCPHRMIEKLLIEGVQNAFPQSISHGRLLPIVTEMQSWPLYAVVTRFSDGKPWREEFIAKDDDHAFDILLDAYLSQDANNDELKWSFVTLFCHDGGHVMHLEVTNAFLNFAQGLIQTEHNCHENT